MKGSHTLQIASAYMNSLEIELDKECSDINQIE